jgi:hypothetical protein
VYLNVLSLRKTQQGEPVIFAGFCILKMSRHGKHRPGYVSPSEKKLRNYVIQLRPETIAAWKAAAARAGMSQRQAAEHLFCSFAREHGVDAPSPPQRTNGQIKPLTRLIVPPLDC